MDLPQTEPAPGVNAVQAPVLPYSSLEGDLPPTAILTLRNQAEAEWALAPYLAQEPIYRASPDGGVSFPRWTRNRCHEHALTAKHPYKPSVVRTYSRSGSSRLLVGDFDPSKAEAANTPDPVEWVAGETAAFVALIRRLGGHAITDVSPWGGRHAYVLFAQPQPFADMSALIQALAQRFVSLDVAPMIGRGGLISPPGSPHKLDPGTGRLSGWRRLTMPLETAFRIARNPCGPEVWSGLLQELTAEYQAIRPTAPAATADDVDLELLPHDEVGAPWIPRFGGRSPLPADFAQVAMTGTFPDDRHGDDASAWRQALLASLAARGWRLEEVLAQIRSRQWPGIPALYRHKRRREPNRMERLLPKEWRVAVRHVAKENPGRNSHTRGITTRPPAPFGSMEWAGVKAATEPQSQLPVHSKDRWSRTPPTPFQVIRTWQNALYLAEHDTTTTLGWGRQAISVRKVLRALGKASQMSGSITTGFGVRSLSLSSGVSYSTVAAVLRRLRDEDDPWVTHDRLHYHEEPDYYRIRIPGRYREAAMWRRWQSGTFDGIHRVFRKLPAPAAFVFEALTMEPVAAGDIARASAVSSSSTTTCLQDLAAVGLAERIEGKGWRRGPTDLDTAAGNLGADTLDAQLVWTYGEDRRLWHLFLQLSQALRRPWDIPSSWTQTNVADPGPDYGTPIEVLAEQEPPEQDPWEEEEPTEVLASETKEKEEKEEPIESTGDDPDGFAQVRKHGPPPALARVYKPKVSRHRRRTRGEKIALEAATRRALAVLRAGLGDGITVLGHVDTVLAEPTERPPPAPR